MIVARSVKLALKKCKETETTGAATVLRSQTGLRDQELSKKSKTCPLVLDSVAEVIYQLYPRRQGSIWKRPEQKRWMQWSSPLTDQQILGVMSDEGRGLLRGCYWGETTRFGVLDIDKGSQYHNVLDLIDLTYRFARCGLVLNPYQSSESGAGTSIFILARG